MKAPHFPVSIRRGSVVTKIYRVRRVVKLAAGPVKQELFTAAWHVGGVRVTRQFPTYAAAHAEASMKADQLAAGRIDAAATLTAEDGSTLSAARKLCGSVPLMAALQEWAAARRLCEGPILPAAEAWAASKAPKFKSVSLGEVINAFIADKDKAGKEGERTYRSKLKPLIERFGAEAPLDSISSHQLSDYLAQFADGVTRNDMRKRARTLWRWARAFHYLPANLPLAVDATERAKEKATDIGIINAATFSALLEFFRAEHPEHLAALVLAGFCGIRADEIHGKRSDRSLRQTWEDVHLDKRIVRVTIAKVNTQAWRHVPLCDAAIEWLLLCPERKGDLCEAGALEKIRYLVHHATNDDGSARFRPLPDNCFRHSFISYRIALTGNKPQVALEAGNSVVEIDRRYRVPVTKEEGEEWFAIRPKRGAEVVRLKEKAAVNA